MNRCLYLLFITTFLCTCAFADTFTHRTDGTVYHGYAEHRKKAGKTVVHTVDDGIVELNLAEYRTDRNTKGRNDSIAVLSILGEISVKMETEAFIEALIEESDKGPLFILMLVLKNQCRKKYMAQPVTAT